jgi:hypothetical protein
MGNRIFELMFLILFSQTCRSAVLNLFHSSDISQNWHIFKAESSVLWPMILEHSPFSKSAATCNMTLKRILRALNLSGGGGTVPCIVNLGTRWRWVVSFTPRLFYTKVRAHRTLGDKRLGRPQIRSGRCGEERNPMVAPSGIWVPLVLCSLYSNLSGKSNHEIDWPNV